MKKFVIETVQIIKRKYYVKVDDPTWAHDGITMEELDHFSEVYLNEDIISTTEVESFPAAEYHESVNGAVMKFNKESAAWLAKARWDLAK